VAILLTLVAALSPLVIVAVLGGDPGRVAAALVLTGVLFVLTLLAGASNPLALLPYAAAAAALELLLAGVLIRRAFRVARNRRVR